MEKCYIVLNNKQGWKIVLDGKKIDCTNPLMQYGLGEKELEKAKLYCLENNLEIVRICK